MTQISQENSKSVDELASVVRLQIDELEKTKAELDRKVDLASELLCQAVPLQEAPLLNEYMEQLRLGVSCVNAAKKHLDKLLNRST